MLVLLNCIILYSLLYFNPFITKQIIVLKEKKTDSTYQRYKQYGQLNRITDLAMMLSLTLLFTKYSEGLLLAYYLMMSYLTIVLYRIDQQIRIIPNEIVLFILISNLTVVFMSEGLNSLLKSFVAMLYVGFIFFSAAYLMKALVGEFGVGAGDIKLSIALAAGFNMQTINYFLIGLSIALVVYVLIGFLFKQFTLKTSFPMAIQIMTGFLLASLIVMKQGVF